LTGIATVYVCLCKGITDSQIRDAVADGVTSYSHLRKSLGIASQCGRCGITAREIFKDALPPHPRPESLFYPAAMAMA
jgi:bacterioferritin-associated ferredoxin